MKTNWLRRGLACALAGALLAVAGCGDGDDTPTTTPPPPVQTGSVSGVVALATSGAPLGGVSVKAAGRSASSAADGSYTLTEVPVAEAQVVSFERSGHTGNTRRVAVTAGSTARANVRLTPVARTQTVDAASAAVVTAAGSTAQVSLPAAAYVTASGAAASGPVTVELTPLDPAADPANMPGNYTARPAAAGAAPQPIESFGAIDVKLKDAAGNPLNLAAGKTAVIRIPLSTRAAEVPATIPLYWFDEASGLWVQEGSATLAGSAPNRYYEGTVSHFTTWNADQAANTIRVTGCVQDAAGARLAGAEVESQGSDYSGADYVRSDANGNFSVAIRRGGIASVYAQTGPRSSNVVRVGPSQVDIVLPACLVMSSGGTAPQIVVQPQSQTTQVGSYVYFQVEAIGSPALRYQWKRNGVDIAGATSSIHFLFQVAAADNAASFTVTVSNDFGSVTSQPAVLTVDSTPLAPLIEGQPQPRTVAVGATATFAVQATGRGGSLSYQWRRNGTAIAGATASSYTTPATVTGDDGALFSVVVASSNGTSVTSNSARLTVAVPTPLAITAQPQNASVGVGQSASFSVGTSGGSGTPTYQWRRNGSPIAGATAVSYTTPATVLADSGAVYSVAVTSGAETVTSAGATLTVTQPSGGNGYYLIAPGGLAVQGTITFANGVQTLTGQALLAVNSANPGAGAVTVEPAGQASYAFSTALEATISGGQVRNTRTRFATYFKGGRLYKVDQVVANGLLPAPQLVSSLTSNEICGQGGLPNLDNTASGLNLADPSRGWLFLRAPGADSACNTADDVFRAVRLDMAASEPGLTIAEPQVAILAGNGAFNGLIVRSGSQLQRLDANLANPTNLFTVSPSTYDNDGFTFGTALPGRWLFIEGGKLWGVDLAAPATRVELTTLANGESSNRSVIVSDDSGAYVAIGTASATRVLRVTEAFAVSTVASIAEPVAQMALTPTRVVLATQGTSPNLLSVPKAGGATTTLRAFGSRTIASDLLAAGENVWVSSYALGGSSTLTVETLVVGADGSNPQTLVNTSVERGLAPAVSPTALGLDQVYAVVLADNVTSAGSNAGGTLRAVEGATRNTLVTYGTVPAAAGGNAFIITGDPFQYGQSGLLAYTNGSSSSGVGWDLLYYKSDAAGLVRATNLIAAASAPPSRAGSLGALRPRRERAAVQGLPGLRRRAGGHAGLQ